MSIEFLITTFIIVASPGSGVLYTLATGLSQGGRAGVVAAFGCTLGIVPHMAAAIGGMAAILHTSALAFEIVKYLGVAYLLFMAWNAWRERGSLAFDAQPRRQSALRITVTAVLVNILNPKLSIFFLAFLPQFIRAGDPQPVLRMLLLGAVFMGMTFVVFAIYGVFAAGLRGRLLGRPAIVTWMRRSFAAAFVLLGAKLALAER